MCLGCSTSVKAMRNYLHLIEVTKRNKDDFERDIHPNSLNKYRQRQDNIIHELAELTLDAVGIPKKNIKLRTFYLDCIHELFVGKTINKKHLEEVLINWKEHDIIKQAE